MKNSFILTALGISTVNAAVDVPSVNSIQNENNPKYDRTHVAGSSTWMQYNNRKLDSDNLELVCDQAFFQCMPVPECSSCFMELKDGSIDWATVTDDTPCKDVTEILFDGGHCKDLKGKNDAIDIFCTTYNVCVPWYNSQKKGKVKPGTNGTDDTDIDCSSLKECNWEGFHRGFIGDGICHENYPGCYNTEICNFDGGDCCEDMCEDNKLAKCGHDGFACRDPSSKKCDPSLSKACNDNDDDGKTPDDGELKDCTSDETEYRLLMFDSFGDGWDSAHLTIAENKLDPKVVFSGGLASGASGTKSICLSSSPTCYNVKVDGGIWGNEISWEIRPLSEGAKPLADGASSMECSFSVAGESCDRTCNGKPDTEFEDPNYMTYKDLSSCIEEKCLIQNSGCKGDISCSPCLTDEPSAFCFANDNFNTVIDCTLCQCTNNHDDFCESKSGAVTPSKKDESRKKPCTSAETLNGSNALMKFTTCTNFDQVGAMVTEFDTNNFGDLDTFEACAHSFNADPGHGGRTAMQCMQILFDSVTSGETADDDDNANLPKAAIAALAGLVYNDAQNFCECASAASDECPLCPNFIHFKTLLYESLDACKALDEIDCDAWVEFHPKCKANLEGEFQNIDFKQEPQCAYVKNSCGDAGPFPAFRKLDCGGEISKASWDFYNLFSRDCLTKDDGIPPDTTPATPPPAPPTDPSTTPAPTQKPTEEKKPYVPEGGKGSKQYIPSDDDQDSGSQSGSQSSTTTETSHFWRNILVMGLLGGGAYVYYKRNNESFSFVRYRQAPRNFGVDGNTLYNGLTMESGASSFEPPSLPPPPSAMNSQPHQYHPQQHL